MKSLMNMTTADHGGSLGPVCAGESAGNIRRRVADGAAPSSAEPGLAGRYRLPAGSRAQALHLDTLSCRQKTLTSVLGKKIQENYK